MGEPKAIKNFQIGLIGIIGGLVGGGCIGLVLLLSKGDGFQGGNGMVTTANSPVRVRGGSMTVRATAPWKVISMTPITYCTNANVGNLYIDQPLNTTIAQYSLTGSWLIEVVGHTPVGDGPSSNGILIQPYAGTCNSGSKDPAIQLSTNGTTYSGFYPKNTNIDDDGTYHVRFQDGTPNVPASGSTPAKPGCQGPSGGAIGDEDICERPYKVFFTPDTSQPSVKYPVTCNTAECVIRLEK